MGREGYFEGFDDVCGLDVFDVAAYASIDDT